MEPLAEAKPAPTEEELIQQLAKPIQRIMSSELADECDQDRVWLLRRALKHSLYYRDLAYFAPALYQGIVDATGVDGSIFPDNSSYGQGRYDLTQNLFRGYCRKLEAVLGTRIPNAVAVPNDPTDEKDIQAARAANNAAIYIREHCDLQVQILWLVFKLFNFGTCFWYIDWVIDAEKYGMKEVPQDAAEDTSLGGGFECPSCGQQSPGDQRPEACPQCGAPMDMAMFRPPLPVQVPANLPPKLVPKGGLEVDVLDVTEIAVPLDVDGRAGVNGCYWLRREREVHKAVLLKKYGDTLRNAIKNGENSFADQSVAMVYGESVRSAMASPIGVVRPKRENKWTEAFDYWTPAMYEMADDRERQIFKENFPSGLRITSAKGHIVALEDCKLTDHWQECQPEPTSRIMCEPLGEDWVVTQDICNNILNQEIETIERSNEPGFADPTRVDLDAWQRRRDTPADLIPAVRPPGGTLADLIYRPPAVTFSEQIPPFRQQTEETSREITGLLDIIWGGDTSDPTARQSELKTNAAIRQLSVIWVQMGKSLESLYEKCCDILAAREDGILAFSKQKANQYGKFDSVAVVIEDLKGGNYHFEADEAIPMSWSQQRDLLMWLLDKPAEILKGFGVDDPLNIVEIKELLGIPGMRVPHVDERDKAMSVISDLIDGKPQPGPIDPQTGQPGPLQSSIQPDWEEDHSFVAKLAKAWLVTNPEIKTTNPDGYQNVVLWGQAQEKLANQENQPPKPPVKASVALSLKGENLGDQAVTQALQTVGIEPPGVSAVATAPPPKQPPPQPSLPLPSNGNVYSA